MKPEIIGAAAIAAVALILHSQGGGDGGGSGGFGGGGEETKKDEAAAEAGGQPVYNITFPESPQIDWSSMFGAGPKLPDTSNVDYFRFLKAVGERPTVGESGDIMAAFQFDISDYRSTTKKLPKPPSTGLVLPFVGQTNVPKFWSATYLKTHNIYGKRIETPAGAPAAVAPTKKFSSGAARKRYFDKIAPNQQLDMRIKNY